jgi:hypothetical protein
MFLLLGCFLIGLLMLGMDLLTESRCSRSKQNPRLTLGGRAH